MHEDLSELPTALGFDTLPSERSPMTPASKLLRDLAERAAMGIKNYRALRTIDRPKKHLDFYTQPGAFIERMCSVEDRQLLREMTSADAAVLGFQKEWLDDGRPGKTR